MRRLWLVLCLALVGCGGPRMETPRNFGTYTPLTCVPYARAVSGIELSGDAWEWWDEADGVYPRALGGSPKLSPNSR